MSSVSSLFFVCCLSSHLFPFGIFLYICSVSMYFLYAYLILSLCIISLELLHTFCVPVSSLLYLHASSLLHPDHVIICTLELLMFTDFQFSTFRTSAFVKAIGSTTVKHPFSSQFSLRAGVSGLLLPLTSYLLPLTSYLLPYMLSGDKCYV